MALRAFIAASLLVVAGFCRAQAFTVGDPSLVDGSATIYRVNLASRSVSVVGTAGNGGNGQPIVAVGALTFSPTDNNLYALALTGASSPTLVTLNQSSGKAATVSQVAGVASTLAKGLSLSFDCTGRLWMASADSNNFWELTPGTGQTRLVGNLGVKITGLAFRNGALWGVGGTGNANLYTIATDSGKATSVGAYGVAVSTPVDAGFDAAGTLWALIRNYDGFNPPTQLNRLAQINLTTGAMTVAGTIAGPSSGSPLPETFQGLATAAPVCAADPSPPAVGAPVLSLAGIGALILSLLLAALSPFSRRQLN
ncbi:MAG: hypothetical protein JSS42_00390 [Proteobacteria bacterium]|uniref:hypothetical protein n=1 Tax=Rudaea sp. TaxID=2136325 RepID=UPI0032200AC2|nr:hypothetical protein [Pseudomonadota bacterium]